MPIDPPVEYLLAYQTARDATEVEDLEQQLAGLGGTPVLPKVWLIRNLSLSANDLAVLAIMTLPDGAGVFVARVSAERRYYKALPG